MLGVYIYFCFMGSWEVNMKREERIELMEKIIINAIKKLIFLKHQGIITSYNIIDEDDIEFKFKVNGYEEEDSCGIEEYTTITGRIKEAEAQYWQDIEDEENYKNQLESDYWAVQL
jgi:hypothetical protein